MPPTTRSVSPRREAGDGAAPPLSPRSRMSGAARLALVLAARQGQQGRRRPRFRQPVGAGALAVQDDRHFGLGEQLQEIGPRAAQADLEHAVGHRDDILDRAEHRLQRVAARPAQRGAEPRHDLLGGDRLAVRPLGAAQAEGVAQPVVGDDPALRQRRLDLAGGVEADQALGGRLEQEGGGGVDRLEVGVDRGAAPPRSR